MKFAKIVSKVKKISEKRGYIFQEKSPKLDFSLSENPTGEIPPKVKMTILDSIAKINVYPVEQIEILRKTIAKNFNLKSENIAIGAGLEQVLENTLKTLVNPGDQVIIPNPSFWLFEKSAILVEAKCLFVKPGKNFSLDLETSQKKVSPKTKLVIFANPNNPTGQIIPKKSLENFVQAIDPIWVIIDEANIEFGGESLISKVKKFKNLVVLRTFSKALGLAGLRVGFCAGPTKFIKAFRKVSQPTPITSLSCAAAEAALADKTFTRKVKIFTGQQRELLIKALRQAGIKVFPSQSNNILVKTDYKKFQNFLKKNKISFVDASCFRDIPKGCFRISPRNEIKNKQLIKLLKKV